MYMYVELFDCSIGYFCHWCYLIKLPIQLGKRYWLLVKRVDFDLFYGLSIKKG